MPPRSWRATAAADGPVLLAAAAILTLLAALLAPRDAALLAIAAALGWLFIASGFGFTAGFRAYQSAGNGAPLAASLLIPAIAALVIVPVAGLVAGYGSAVAPPGLGVIAGAALFGVGMQLANGCGSGTLAAAGGGSRRMWIALPFFSAGGVLGSLALPSIEALPGPPPLSLAGLLGVWPGLFATLVLLAALAAWLLRTGARPSPAMLRTSAAIGGLAALLFLISGTPWGITMGLTLAGAKLAASLHLPIAESEFWRDPAMLAALQGSLLDHPSALADIGLLLGAAACAGWRGSFRGQVWPDRRGALAAMLGGLLMGIGARLSYGCNIGAFVGGVAASSLHGFLWFAAVLPGSWLGIRLRPAFGLAIPAPPDGPIARIP